MNDSNKKIELPEVTSVPSYSTLVDWWDAWPEAKPAHLDFWARGNFTRRLLSRRGSQRAACIVRVEYLDEIEAALKRLALLDLEVDFAWYGEVSQPQLVIVPQDVDYEDTGGWGYSTCAGSEITDHRGACCTNLVSGTLASHKRRSDGTCTLAKLVYATGSEESGYLLDECFALDTKRADQQALGLIWARRALCAMLMGNADAALVAARRARELADVERVEADIIGAEWLLGTALLSSMFQVSSSRLRGKKVGSQHGTWNVEPGTLREAEQHLTEALTRCRRINLVEVEPDILLAWARWHHATGNPEQACQDAHEALAIADRCEYRLKQAEIHNFLARLALEAGDRPAACHHAQIARERAWCDGPPHCYQPALEEADGLLKGISDRRG